MNSEFRSANEALESSAKCSPKSLKSVPKTPNDYSAQAVTGESVDEGEDSSEYGVGRDANFNRQENDARLTPAQQKYEGGALCEAHAAAYDMPPGTYFLAQPPVSDDEPIECDCCTVHIMRQAGVL